MGTLKYDGTTVDFPDGVLAHIELVVVQKLRRQESFLLSWHESTASGGRTGVWMHPAAVLTFHYASTQAAEIDRHWVERLAEAASTAQGLFVADADGQPVQSSAEEAAE